MIEVSQDGTTKYCLEGASLMQCYAFVDTVKALCSVIYYLLAPEKLQLDDDNKPPKFPAHHRNNAGYFHTNVSKVAIMSKHSVL